MGEVAFKPNALSSEECFAYTALLHFTSLEICIPAKMAGHARNVDRFANEIRQPIDDEREV